MAKAADLSPEASNLLPNETHRSLGGKQALRHGNVPPVVITPADSFHIIPRVNTGLSPNETTDPPEGKSARPPTPAPAANAPAANAPKNISAEPPLFRDDNDVSPREENTPDDADLNPHIAGDAIRRAIEAELEATPERRTLKLATIAAGLFFSTLAVWWSLSGSPFSSRTLDQMAQETTHSESAEVHLVATTPVASAIEKSEPANLPGAAEDACTSVQPDPTPAVTAFINSLEINVLPQAASRVILVGDVSYREGAVLEPAHGLTLAHIDEEARTLYFKDAIGAVYNRRY